MWRVFVPDGGRCARRDGRLLSPFQVQVPLLLPVHVRGQSFAHSVREPHRELHLALLVLPVLADESPRKSEAWILRLAPSKMRYLWPVGIEETRHMQRERSQRLVSRGWSLLLLNAF
jgi:hypothetical protein